jgi:hypothetical protein
MLAQLLLRLLALRLQEHELHLTFMFRHAFTNIASDRSLPHINRGDPRDGSMEGTATTTTMSDSKPGMNMGM